MNQYVPSTELKSKLSEYLRLVGAGQSFCVTLRGTPIARIEPITEDMGYQDALAYMESVKKDGPLLSGKRLKTLLQEDRK